MTGQNTSFIHSYTCVYYLNSLCSEYSPAYLWHEGSACLPYKPLVVEAPAWCFQFHPATGGHACAQYPLSTAFSTHPFCSAAASYKTGGFPSPMDKKAHKKLWPVLQRYQTAAEKWCSNERLGIILNLGSAMLDRFKRNKAQTHTGK